MRMGTIFLVLFFALFYAIGLGVFGYGLYAARQSTAAGNWPTTTGTITSCTLSEKSDSDGNMYEVKIEYKYNVGGIDYTGSRLAFGYKGSTGRAAHNEIYEKLKDAKTVDVRYDPFDPALSTLSFGIHRSILFMLIFGGAWLAFVVGMSLLLWVSSLKESVLLEHLSVQ